MQINKSNKINLKEYCKQRKIKKVEAVNNILAEFFLEKRELQDDKRNNATI